MAPLLDGRSLLQRLKEAKDLLQEHGYVVKGPLASKYKVQTAPQLVHFFYDTLALYNPQFKLVFSGNPKDRAIAKRMIESRTEQGASRERAVVECCELITLLFKYEEALGLTFKITSMGVLGHEKMAWVTERLLQIYEGVNRQVSQEEEYIWWQSLYDRQEQGVDEFKLENARIKMDKILERYAEEEKD